MAELPKYNITIDPQYSDGEDNLGIDMIAFTSDPAILVKGVAFRKQKKEFFADEKKYRITAPAMIPMDIYRNDEDGEYEVTFEEGVIDSMHNKFMSNLNNKELFNLEHNAEDKVPAYILEAWIVDNPKGDKSYTTFGIEVPKGTLMVTAQITDKDYYNKLVENGQTGFSIEGMMGLSVSQSNQLNQYKMSNENFTPEDGKQYVFSNGKFEEVKEEVVETEEKVEMMEEEEEVTEEVVASEEVTEEVVTEEEMAVDPAVDAEAILSIVMPVLDEKLNEVLQVIADLRNEMLESSSEAVDGEAELEMSASKKQGFNNLLKFLKNG